MPRTSPLYYIAPSAISITPNANGSSRDLAVYVARGAKVKLYDPRIAALGMGADSTFQEWTLSGRNRRLAETDTPYTIYARLAKTGDKTGYLVFAAQTHPEGSEEWIDPYVLSPNTSATSALNNITGADGNRYSWSPIPSRQAQGGRSDYWWVKLGTVSAPDENGQRTVDLDTGILGTDQYNSQWHLNPDDLPEKEVRYILEDRGQWTATPKVTYTGSTGQRAPDGTLDSTVATALGWTGEEPLSFTQGQEIDEPYHYRSLTRQRWLAARLATDYSDYTDADLYVKLTGPTKGWEVENTLETSRVWKGGKLWECMVDGTAQSPLWGSADWQVIGGNMVWGIDFASTNGNSFYQGHVQTTVTARLYWGDEDITAIVGAAVFTWTRSSEEGKNDADRTWDAMEVRGNKVHQGTNILNLGNNDMPTAWSRINKAIFTCTAAIEDGETTEYIQNQVIV